MIGIAYLLHAIPDPVDRPFPAGAAAGIPAVLRIHLRWENEQALVLYPAP